MPFHKKDKMQEGAVSAIYGLSVMVSFYMLFIPIIITLMLWELFNNRNFLIMIFLCLLHFFLIQKFVYFYFEKNDRYEDVYQKFHQENYTKSVLGSILTFTLYIGCFPMGFIIMDFFAQWVKYFFES